MVFALKSPNGSILNLDYYLTGTGGTGATTGFVNTTVSSTGVNALSTGTGTYTGTFKADAAGAASAPPAGPTGFTPTVTTWTPMFTPIPNGTWTMAMYDGGGGDVGTLTNWTITVDYTTPGTTNSTLSYVWSPLTGLYTDPQAINAYTGTNTPVVYAAPTTLTTYTVTTTNTVTGCVSTASVLVNYTPPAPTVTPNPVAMCLGDVPVKLKSSSAIPATAAVWTPASGLFSNSLGTIPYVAGTAVDSVWAAPTTIGANPYTVTVQSLPALQPTPVTFTNPANIVINNVGTASPSPANLAVTGLATTGVTVRSVNINDFSHTWAGDVNMVLQSPTGQNVILMANSNADPLIAVTNINLTFDDAATASLPAAAPMASGTYKPTNRNGATFAFLAPGPTVTGPTFPASPTLSTFTGNMNGTWKLFVEDRVAGDAGSIAGGFSINFNVPLAPCTSPARTVVVTVNQPTTLNAALPANQTICTDKVATFTTAVTAGTGPHSYQWQVSIAGGAFTNIANGGVYSGVTTATLVITAPPVSMSGYRYRAVVAGAAPCAAATSNSALLTVNPLPAFTISAAPYTSLLPGLRTTVSASTIIPPATPFVYSWIRNGTPLGSSALGVVSGLGTASILLDVDGMGDYQLRVTDANGCTNTSNSITIKDSASAKCFIYPNPNSGQFQVRYYSVAGNNNLPRGIVVYDAKGDRVFVQNYTVGRPYDRMDVDMRAYGKGLYWVEVVDRNGNRLTMCRVVIQ
jgi:subtilisin-like proprotein convertase family protein